MSKGLVSVIVKTKSEGKERQDKCYCRDWVCVTSWRHEIVRHGLRTRSNLVCKFQLQTMEGSGVTSFSRKLVETTTKAIIFCGVLGIPSVRTAAKGDAVLSPKNMWFHPWIGKIPWRRKWQPTPVLLPGKSHGWRSLEGCSPWGR